jgi:hypothetical protein
MAAQKFLQNVSGKINEIFASVTSTPNAIVAMDATGRVDISVLPVGVGSETITAVASEAITAGAFVNYYSNAGVLNVRNADATTNAKPANGFVLASVAAAATATIYLASQTNNAVTGLVIGSDYYLSTTPGAGTATAPSATGNIVQPLGRADKVTEIVFVPLSTVEIA